MRNALYLILLLALSCAHSHGQNPTNRAALPGNTVRELINDGTENTYFDPINDSVHYKKVIDNFYQGPGNKVYILTQRTVFSDTTFVFEYYRDISYIIDLKTYKRLDDTFFVSKRKVYMWAGTSDGEIPYEIDHADAASFVPFKEIAGGTDNKHVFYWDVQKGSIEIIPGANPKTIQVLCPAGECWNCGGCYFIDNKQVFYANTPVPGADPKTFRLITEAGIDAADQHAKYFQGGKMH